MKHFSQLTEGDAARIFRLPPAEFDRDTKKELLQYALGATMYIPAVKDGTLELLLSRKYLALTSLVLCLEDAIGPGQSAQAMDNLLALFSGLDDAANRDETLVSRLPLIFIRVRTREELERLLDNRQVLRFCCGFVLPKYEPESGRALLGLIDAAGGAIGAPLYALPLIETARVIARLTRVDELAAIRASFAGYEQKILNIRVGGTDFSGLYGLRRSAHDTIYDLRVVGDCLCDILNAFCLGGDTVVSGPVWEYYAGMEETQQIAQILINGGQPSLPGTNAVQGLIRETRLDLLNGFCGKTVIHPSQIAVVNALLAVCAEDYTDAQSISAMDGGGVERSAGRNRMNEASPHKKWAKKLLARAAVYGVLNPNENAYSLF